MASKTLPTEKWLLDGAYSIYLSKGDKKSVSRVILAFTIIIGCAAICLEGYFLNNPTSFFLAFMGTILGFAFSVAQIIFSHERKIRKKVSNSQEWQKTYLQSKIREYDDYQLKSQSLIDQAVTTYNDTLTDIQNSLDAMKEKAGRAREILLQL